MKVRRVVVEAGRVVPRPGKSKESLAPRVRLAAELNGKEDLDEVTAQLQGRAEELVEKHAKTLVTTERRAQKISATEKEIAEAEAALEEDKARLEALRRKERQLRHVQETLPGVGKDKAD